MNTLHDENYFTTSQVADLLGVTRITIFRWIQEGTMKAQKIGRNYAISQDEVMRHVGKHPLTEEQKAVIRNLVDKTVKEYGETIRMLGRE